MELHLPLTVIGISHKSAGVKGRELVAMEKDEQQEVARSLLHQFQIDGCFVVSTCNRTEIYFSGEHTEPILAKIKSWLDGFKKCCCFSDENMTYTLKHRQAVTHFFNVISGLDSQMIGEPQITGQVKEGYYLAKEANTTDTVLNKIFNFGMQAQKKVRSETFLGAGAVSVSFAGVELAEKVFNKLEDKSVLLIGAGDTAELAAVHFQSKGVGRFRILNRTRANAENLAEKFSGQAFGFEDMWTAFDEVDIVISATSSPVYILTIDFVRELVKKRQQRPLLLIDLAVPRDIDPNIAGLDGLFLYNLDDLEEIVEQNRVKRLSEIPKAEKIVTSFVDDYIQWLKSHSLSATISDLKRVFEVMVQNELKRTLRQDGGKNGNALELLGNNIINKLMRQHMKLLKKNEKDPEKKEIQLRVLRELYELDQMDT